MASLDSYFEQLRSLLPKGPAWSTEPGSTLRQLVRGLAQELFRVHLRAEELIEESDPRTTLELLSEYERNFALPEPCVQQPDTVGQRRLALTEKWTRYGQATPAYFQTLVRALGFPHAIVVEHYDSADLYKWRIDFAITGAKYWTVNDPVNGQLRTWINEYLSWWTVSDEVNKPLRDWYVEYLYCVIERTKPAHTFVEYAFVVIEPAGPPESVSATATGRTTIRVTYQAPTDTGGAPITGYRVDRSLDNMNWTVIVENTMSTALFYDDQNLAPGTTYYYRLAAINLNGPGNNSLSDSATTLS